MMTSDRHRRLEQLTDEARRLRDPEFPNGQWDDDAWVERGGRAHKKANKIWFLTAPQTRRIYKLSPDELGALRYPRLFGNLVRSVVVILAHRRGTRSFQCHKTAGRLLYEATGRADAADPTRLNRRNFIRAENLAQERYSPGTAYGLGLALEDYSRIIDEYRIAALRIGFHSSIPPPQCSDGLDEQSQRKGAEKMPADEALDALIEISKEPRSSAERFFIRIFDLLMVGGWRIGEVLSLPADCWIEERVPARNGRFVTRYGIRYWPEKIDPAEGLRIKVIPAQAVHVARRAVEELRGLTDGPRQIAAVIESDPTRVPLKAALDPNELITRKQAGDLTGYRDIHTLVRNLDLQPAVPSVTRGRGRGNSPNLYRVGDVERALARRLGPLEVLNNPHFRQPLSKSLFCTYVYQFDNSRPTIECLVRPVSYGAVFMRFRDAETSIFARRGMTTLSLRLHSPRHWLNTLLHRGGVSEHISSHFFGRMSPSSESPYLHETVADGEPAVLEILQNQPTAWHRVEVFKALFRRGVFAGDLWDVYSTLTDMTKSEAFLDASVQAVHVSPYGICIHHYSIDQCPYNVACLDGCPDYVRTAGDQVERRKIRALKVLSEFEANRAAEAAALGEWGAVKWKQMHEQRALNCATALAVDADDTPHGACVRPFEGEPAIGLPLK